MRTKRCVRWLRKSVLCVGSPERRSAAELSRAAADVVMLSRFYYVFLAFSIGTTRFRFSQAYPGRPPTAPLWPIEIIEWLTGWGWFARDQAVTMAGFGLAVAAAAFPRTLLWRLGSFAYLLVHVSLDNSYGSINHGSHVIVFVGFALLFLPGRDGEGRGQRMSRTSVLQCLNVLWFAQGLILLSYTLAGFQKLWHSRLEVFALDSMSRILIDRAVSTAEVIPELLPFALRHNWLTQSTWWATLYIEVFALLVVFRPHLHRLWGAVLMLFHIMSNWLMNITFPFNVLMPGLFLLLSPLAPTRFSLSGTLGSLPIVGIGVRAIERRRQSQRAQQPRHASRVWLVYDGECPMCSNYAQLLRLRQSVDEFVLVDARQGGPIVEEVRRLPHNLNDAMVVKIGEQYYVGHEALRVLALLAEGRGAFNKLNRLAFSSSLIARLAYPLMQAVRRVLLKLKGIAPIPSGDGVSPR